MPLRRHTWHAIRQRPFLRNIFYGALFLLCLYFLRPTQNIQDHDNLSSEENVVDLPPQTWDDTARQVKRAFLHAYHGYEQYAAPHDELTPLSDAHSDKFNRWGVSMFDSLDTMLIMELDAEFNRTLSMIKQVDFSLPKNSFAPYFETVIRYLGGLLSGYALSKNKMLLDKADDLATKLDPVFNTTTGLALYGVNPTSKTATGSDIGILAELGSLQLEYSYLAKLTGKKEHFTKANTLLKVLDDADLRYTGGMLPTRWNLTSGQPHDGHISVGAQADSAHEYLLKQYLLTARADKASLKMYLRATTHIITNLLYLSPTRHLLYVTDQVADREGQKTYTTHLFEHLSCFLPGLLALGAYTLPLNDLESLGVSFHDLGGNGLYGDAGRNFAALADYDLKKLHLWAAEGLAQTCYLTYADQPTGLGPDEVVMKSVERKGWSRWRNGQGTMRWIDAMNTWKRSGSRRLPPGLGDKKRILHRERDGEEQIQEIDQDYNIKKPGYLLRPETVESLYILWRITGNPKWRICGKTIFEAIEKEAKTRSGYASLTSVVKSPAALTDDMPSYFLAETLKYLYLMFIDKDPIPLDRWVFNTEAHPFPVFEWSPSERHRFNISS